MAKRRTKNESFENLKTVTANDSIDTVGAMDIVTENACIENSNNEKHLEEVMDELNKKAEDVVGKPEDITAPEIKEPDKDKPSVTAKLVLDESIEDFVLVEDENTTSNDYKNTRVTDRFATDPLDFDMFDFIYNLFVSQSEGDEKPLDALGRHSFMYIGSDSYKFDEVEDAEEGPNNRSRVGVSGDKIELYGNNTKVDPETGKKIIGDESKFDKVIQLCDKYKLTYEGPIAKRNRNSFFDFSYRIHVPLDKNGYPELLVDYIKKIGMRLEDVMNATFCANYNKIVKQFEKEQAELLNDSRVNRCIEDAIKHAFSDSEPLKTHLDKLFHELDSQELKYVRKHVKTKFMDAMNDDPYADDEE